MQKYSDVLNICSLSHEMSRCCSLGRVFQANCLQCNVSRGHQFLTAAFVCHADAGRSVWWMKCSGDLWRRKPFSNGSGIFLPPLPPSLPSPSMKMINGIAHKVNSTRKIAFYLWWTYLSPVVVNLSSWDPVRRQRRRVQTPPSLPRPCAKVLTLKSLGTFFFFNAPKMSLCTTKDEKWGSLAGRHNPHSAYSVFSTCLSLFNIERDAQVGDTDL